MEKVIKIHEENDWEELHQEQLAIVVAIKDNLLIFAHLYYIFFLY